MVAIQGAVPQLGDIYRTMAVRSPQASELDEPKEMITAAMIFDNGRRSGNGGAAVTDETQIRTDPPRPTPLSLLVRLYSLNMNF